MAFENSGVKKTPSRNPKDKLYKKANLKKDQ